MNLYNEALAAKDAEIATLSACVLKLQDSLCAAKRHELAAPAPIQSAEVPFMWAIMGPSGKPHFDENCVSGDKGDLVESVYYLNDESDSGPYKVVPMFLAATPAQPAAAVSAPTDEEMTRLVKAGPDAIRAHLDFARAAAPVSGPTLDDGDTEKLLWCLRTVRAIANLPREAPLGDWKPQAIMVCGTLKRVLGDTPEAIEAGTSDSAAPVSGQGASIADDPKFQRKLGAYWQDSTAESKAALIAYIDSRYREGVQRGAELSAATYSPMLKASSEDSRAKVLEAAAQIAFCHDLGTPDGHAIGNAIRALASTTPPKADNAN